MARDILRDFGIPQVVDVVAEDSANQERIATAVRRVGLEPRVHSSAEAYSGSGLSDLPICVVIDYSASDEPTRSLLEGFADRGPVAAVIIVSANLDVGPIRRLVNLGVGKLLETPLDAERSQRVIGEAAAAQRRRLENRRRQLELGARVDRLSQRERSVIDAIADGKLNREIADQLSVSVRTVESDRSRLVQKLDAKTTGEAIATYSEYRTLSAIESNGHPAQHGEGPLNGAAADQLGGTLASP